ncbi:glycosyltransferase [Streptomyces sp. SID2563]|uniref:glycosyltransferase n=1 Tax=Streptomyces sp. SID2563 TaxID=2690255 RepID=UPI001371A2C1|nr:glycosyltransferase [Streptomyces sp. SID2563]
MTDTIIATRRRRGLLLAGTAATAIIALILSAYGLRTWLTARGISSDPALWAWAPLAALLLTQTVLYLLERPHRADAKGQERLDGLHVAVLMPVFNEDNGYLRAALSSLLAQTRRPDSVHIVDDGSELSHRVVRRWWMAAARDHGIPTSWHRTPNRGKRHAQVLAARQAPEADVHVTVDSDAQLAPDALHEVLQPLADPRVQAVAGLVLARNNRNGLLSRMTDLWYVTCQMVERSAQSPLGSVMVASGSLAAYRAELLTDHAEGYLSETFMGRPVTFSDDSMLTLYALVRGRVVQQPTAVVFTAMPEEFGHHVRQYLRWMRGSSLRALWRVRYLPARHPALAAQLLRWFQQLATTAALVWLLALHLRPGPLPSPLLMAVPLLLTAGQTLRYLVVRRSDQTLRSQLATWALTPLAMLWSWTVLRPLRWYGAATCWKTGWGTRQAGAEIHLAATAPTQPAAA